MTNVSKQAGPGEVSCPNCGSEAEWSFLDEKRSLVEVLCSECGRFEMLREDFDQALSEAIGPIEHE
jgi:uncharacterized Zn finger protein